MSRDLGVCHAGDTMNAARLLVQAGQGLISKPPGSPQDEKIAWTEVLPPLQNLEHGSSKSNDSKSNDAQKLGRPRFDAAKSGNRPLDKIAKQSA